MNIYERVNQLPEEKKELVSFLHDQHFDTFGTFTTRKEISLPATRRLALKFSDAFPKAPFFWVAEKFEVRDGFHFHGLLGVGQDYKRSGMFDYWQRFGRGSFTKLRSDFTAEMYCSKYLTKKVSDYDFHLDNITMRNEGQLDAFFDSEKPSRSMRASELQYLVKKRTHLETIMPSVKQVLRNFDPYSEEDRGVFQVAEDTKREYESVIKRIRLVRSQLSA